MSKKIILSILIALIVTLTMSLVLMSSKVTSSTNNQSASAMPVTEILEDGRVISTVVYVGEDRNQIKSFISSWTNKGYQVTHGWGYGYYNTVIVMSKIK